MGGLSGAQIEALATYSASSPGPPPLDRAALLGLVDTIARPLVVFDGAGTMLLRTAALARLLRTEPGRDALLHAAGALAGHVGATMDDAPALATWLAGPALRERPHRRAYSLTPLVAPAGAFAATRSVVVIIERAQGESHVDPGRVGTALHLTNRQTQVLTLLLARYSTAEIATALGVSSHTARHHVERICRKAQVSGRQGLRSSLLRVAPAT